MRFRWKKPSQVVFLSVAACAFCGGCGDSTQWTLFVQDFARQMLAAFLL